ncbi:MAG: isoamylase early set domain-containing protein [Anaerolineae bacterium]
MITKQPSSRDGKVNIIFEIPGTVWAECIHLVGDFNDWDRDSLPFGRDRRGNWRIELELDAGREYRFRYLFDGSEWRDDWHADKFVPNPHGGFDSLVVAELSPPEEDPPPSGR